jgi:Fe-S cluster assembly protein SufD
MGLTDAPVVAPPLHDRGTLVASFDLADHPVPGGREEAWRFTPLRRLGGLHDGSAAVAGSDGVGVHVDAPEGLRVETVDASDARLGRAGAPDDRVEAQVVSSAREALVVTVPREWVGDQPTVVRLTGGGSPGAAYTRMLVDVEPFADAIVIVDHVGAGIHGTQLEVVVGDGARLRLVSIHDWADDAVHVGRQRFRLGRDARLTGFNATLGGDLVRIYTTVTYDGPGGDADLLGVFFADAGQHLEHRLFVDHGAPQCRSNVTYKGALQGAGSHTVWIGDVLIRAGAVGTDTYEINRNLLLTDGARADSVPNLEIETGEIVGAGHASATGRFDDEQLFYLRSRGIPEDEARRLVVRGFFADVVTRLGVPAVEERLTQAIEAELAAAEAYSTGAST